MSSLITSLLPPPNVFDPDKPTYLQYDGNGPDAKLVGMSWYVRSGAMPPEGFPGDNDWWHVHPELCLSGGLVVRDGPCQPGDNGSTIARPLRVHVQIRIANGITSRKSTGLWRKRSRDSIDAFS